jgi:SAM-dependent methyltransferase
MSTAHRNHRLFILLLGMFVFITIIHPAAQIQDFEMPFQRWDVPYVPTPYEVVDEMLEMAEVTETDTLYDLGCGDGRIVITAARRLGTRGYGVDIDPERIRECHANAEAADVGSLVTFLNQDLFETDFSRASVLTLYLLNSVNMRLRPKILAELRPGTRVVSHDFSMGEWRADEQADMMVDYRIHNVYFWVVPANASGKWRFSQPADLPSIPFTLNLEQKFQEVQGHITTRNQVIRLKSAELKGPQIEFSFDEDSQDRAQTFTFAGTVSGHTMEGTLTVLTGEANEEYACRAKRDPKTQRPIDSEVKRGS